ncbi:unnamed protein product, partial [Symbiodinium sp. KB8]
MEALDAIDTLELDDFTVTETQTGSTFKVHAGYWGQRVLVPGMGFEKVVLLLRAIFLSLVRMTLSI